MSDFPDRFMIGADDFIGFPNTQRQVGAPSFEDTWSLVPQLPEDLRRKVGSENAARLYHLS